MPNKQPNMQKKQVEEKFLIQLQNNSQRALALTIDPPPPELDVFNKKPQSTIETFLSSMHHILIKSVRAIFKNCVSPQCNIESGRQSGICATFKFSSK